ncbi:MAG TPA: helix-turn-helix domain-containing protein [Ktedonobacterales bacterium]
MATVERLVRLGLTLYEARAYVALIRRDGSTPAEVAKVAGVPRPRIYDVIASLVAKGLVSERPGRTARFVAIPPDEAVKKLVSIHRERLQTLEADADAVRAELGPAFLEGSMHSDPLDYIELIRSPEAVAKRFNELQHAAAREMLAFSKMPAAVRVEENDAGLDLARTRVLRSVYEFSLLDDPLSYDGVQRFIDAGEQARFVEELPMKLGIIDERIVMLAMIDPLAGDSGLTTLVIENVQLARCLKIAFEQVWSTGVDFATACERRGVEPPRVLA